MATVDKEDKKSISFPRNQVAKTGGETLTQVQGAACSIARPCCTSDEYAASP
jgi:hypothetical protein